jgi:hypothetical protein
MLGSEVVDLLMRNDKKKWSITCDVSDCVGLKSTYLSTFCKLCPDNTINSIIIIEYCC